MSKLQERLRESMTSYGYSYSDLEKLSGVSRSNIQRYVTGATKEAPIEKIKRLADALHVDFLWLLGYDSVAAEDAEIVGSLAARAKDRLPLPHDIAALNVLLRDAGEIIERTEDGYYTASTGFLSEDDLDFLKTSAVNALKTAVNMLARRRTLELREMLNGKRGTE